jgi:hypothetical protein
VSGCVLRLDCDSRQGARAQQPSRVKLIFVLQQQPVHRLRLLVLVWLGLGWVGLVFVGRLGGMDVKGSAMSGRHLRLGRFLSLVGPPKSRCGLPALRVVLRT